jgi:hypothetical protein
MNTKTKSEAALDLLRACWSKRRASKSLLYLCSGWSLNRRLRLRAGVLAFDPGPPPIRTVALDQLLTGFRRLPEIIENIADQVERRHALSVIAGDKR